MDLRGAEVRLSWIRYTYHAPRAVSLFCSIGGFTEADVVGTDGNAPSQGQPAELVMSLPETAAYQSVSNPVEFRFYFHGGQYDHQAGVTAFKLTAKLRPGTYAYWAAQQDWQGLSPDPAEDVDGDDLPNALEFEMDTSPTATGPDPLIPRMDVQSPGNGNPVLSVTYRRRLGAGTSTLAIEGCTDLRLADWQPLQPDGQTILDQQVDPDPDGDGTAETRRLHIHPGLPFRFFRYASQVN